MSAEKNKQKVENNVNNVVSKQARYITDVLWLTVATKV